jgi:hypothetical protein
VCNLYYLLYFPLDLLQKIVFVWMLLLSLFYLSLFSSLLHLGFRFIFMYEGGRDL